jgi:DNA mismatch repair protein MutH
VVVVGIFCQIVMVGIDYGVKASILASTPVVEQKTNWRDDWEEKMSRMDHGGCDELTPSFERTIARAPKECGRKCIFPFLGTKSVKSDQ